MWEGNEMAFTRKVWVRAFIARLTAVSLIATPVVASWHATRTVAAPNASAGALDTTFDTDGRVVVGSATGFAVGSGTQAMGVALYASGVGNDGRIVLAG